MSSDDFVVCVYVATNAALIIFAYRAFREIVRDIAKRIEEIDDCDVDECPCDRLTSIEKRLSAIEQRLDAEDMYRQEQNERSE